MRYIAFLQGINVGGRHVIKMADLQLLFAGCGFTNVQTYIQSGNVVFDADGAEAALRHRIEQAFESRFSFRSSIALRTEAELAELLDGYPFSPEEIAATEAADPAVEHTYVYLAADTPGPAAALALPQTGSGGDRIALHGRDVYLLCGRSVRNSKAAAALGKLGVPHTARNLRTLRKVLALSQGTPKP